MAQRIYKVILADDEVWINFGIKKLIHKSGLPFEVVGEASNGIYAYEMTRQFLPDVLITDIRMPGLSGLALMRRLREENMPVKVIFISGYAEFAYAQEALQMGAFDYLLKPVKAENIAETLQHYINQYELPVQGIPEEEPYQIGDRRMKKIMRDIDKNYTHKITLGDIARENHLSMGHLSALIKDTTGISFSSYIAGKRIEDAKNLLRNEALSIDEIADMVGYGDYFYFTKVFKKYTGVSPSAFRKNQEAAP